MSIFNSQSIIAAYSWYPVVYLLNNTHVNEKKVDARVGISGTTAKSRKRKFVPSSHPRPFAVVVSSRKSKTKVGTLACLDFCTRMS